MKRTKRRYLALRLEVEDVPSEREIMDAIWISVTKLYGEVGASLTGLALMNFDAERKIVVIRTSLESLLTVRASLATIVNFAGRNVSVHVLAVSGTLRALYKNIRQFKCKVVVKLRQYILKLSIVLARQTFIIVAETFINCKYALISAAKMCWEKRKTRQVE